MDEDRTFFSFSPEDFRPPVLFLAQFRFVPPGDCACKTWALFSESSFFAGLGSESESRFSFSPDGLGLQDSDLERCLGELFDKARTFLGVTALTGKHPDSGQPVGGGTASWEHLTAFVGAFVGILKAPDSILEATWKPHGSFLEASRL